MSVEKQEVHWSDLNLTWWLFSHIRHRWVLNTFNVILTFTRSIWPAVVAWNMALFIDAAVERDESMLAFAMISGVVVYFLLATNDGVLQIIRRVLITGMHHRLRMKTLETVLNAPLEKSMVYKPGDIDARMNKDTFISTDIVTWQLPNALNAPLQALSSYIYLCTIHFGIATSVLLSAPLGGFLLYMIGKKTKILTMKEREETSQLNDEVQENWLGNMIIRCFGLQRAVLKSFGRRLENIYDLEVKLEWLWTLMFIGIRLIFVIVNASVLAYSLVLMERGEITAGELTAITVIPSTLLVSFLNLGHFWPTFLQGLVSAQRVRELWQLPKEEDGEQNLPQAKASQLVIENLNFRYNGNKADAPNTLEDISFSLEAGEHIALVGKSGCGKSTLFKLLMGFYAPHSGKILLDKRDCQDLNKESRRSQMAWVPQESTLFNLSIAENLYLNRDPADASQSRQYLEQVGLATMLSERAEGIDYEVGERGERLSGGERQRVAIARILASECPIVLMDEITASLDSVNEKQVLEELKTHIQDRSSITITHRLSTVKNADRILVMDRGRIVEEGTHLSLIKNGKVYRELCGSLLDD